MASEEENLVWEGKALVDILNIIYLGDDVKPEDQVGTIKLHNSLDSHHIYNQEDEGDNNTKSTLKYGDTINFSLDGPLHATGSTQYLTFDLFRGAYNGPVDLLWDPEDGELYVQKYEVRSTDGTGKILVLVAHYANAVVANLEVKFIKSAARNVYGGIFASNTSIQRPHCANVLFLEKPGTGITIGKDGVITLSKSCIAVPVHSELNVDLSLYLDNASHDFKTLSFNQNKKVDVRYVPVDKEAAVISVRVSWERRVVLSPCDDIDGTNEVNVGEDLALCFHSLKDQIRSSEEIMPKFNLRGISSQTLSTIISHYDAPYLRIPFDQQDVVINLIQAAHFFKFRGLMETTCEFLVNKLSNFKTENAMLMISEFKHFKFSYMRRNSDQHAAARGRVSPDRISRQHRRETFINKWPLVTVPIPSYVTNQLVTVERWKSVFDNDLAKGFHLYSIQDFEKLYEVFESLIDFIIEDIKFADRVSNLETLFEIFMKNNYEIKEIQGQAAKIFSYAISRDKNRKYLEEAVGDLVKLMSDSSIDFNIVAVDALFRIAYASPSCIKVILNQGALEKASELLAKPFPLHVSSSCKLIECVANLLAAVCCGDSDFNKVNLAFAIADEIFQKNLIDNEHKMLACHALQYLTYEKSVEIEIAAWKKLIATLIKFSMDFDAHPQFKEPEAMDTGLIATGVRETGLNAFITRDAGLAASAIGVLGNVARWGNSEQIQTLAKDSSLMECLRKMLRSGIKKFSKEACQIISNIAARNTKWIHDMHAFNLIEPLRNLIHEGDMSVSDVKVEAAWAIFNGIYDCEDRQIDEYPSDEESDK